MRDGKHVVLCVDDDPDVLDYLKIVLESEGYLVVNAGSAEEGLRSYKEQAPDLLIVDLMMEEVDAGTSLVKELRALGSEAPVYLLSSTGDNLDMTTDYSELGLAGVLQKPLAKEQLLGLVQAAL